MKLPKLIYAVVSILVGFSINASYADNEFIQEVGSIDLGPLAQQVAENKKQLMIIYYRGNCKACDELNQMHPGTMSSLPLARDFAIYKTDVSTEFTVTCPNGEEFRDGEFMAVKGIDGLPALVITDSEGNVAFVENNVTNKNKLIAVSEQFKKRYMANSNTDAYKATN